jgi:dTMP kinase
MIDAYLKSHSGGSDQMVHLLFSANRWESASNLLDILNKGDAVILDRYFYSGIAFSAAKGIPGMDINWCKQPDVGLPRPDLTLFLEVSESVQQERGGFGAERYEQAEFQKKVRAVFNQLRQSAGDWKTISADVEFEKVSTAIWHEVEQVLSRKLPQDVNRFT